MLNHCVQACMFDLGDYMQTKMSVVVREEGEKRMSESYEREMHC